MNRSRLVLGMVMLAGAGLAAWLLWDTPLRRPGLFVATGKLAIDPQLKTLARDGAPLCAEDARILVLQLKDSDGVLAFKSPAAEQWKPPIRSAPINLSLIRDYRSRGFHTVAYFQVFKDGAFAKGHPPEAITKASGEMLKDRYGAFVDPASESYKAYFMAMLEDVIAARPDEIMLDYIRYPEYRNLVFPISKFAESDLRAKEQTITDFVKAVAEKVRSKDASIRISCAVFPPGNEVGQSYPGLMPHVNTLYPMIYPSIFGGHTIGGEDWKVSFEEMVAQVCQEATSEATICPFLQAFQFYGEKNPKTGRQEQKTKALEPDLMRWQIKMMSRLGWDYVIFSAGSNYKNLWKVLD